MTEPIEYPALFLKRGEDARLRAGHLWVFSNEVDVARSPLTGFEPGEIAAIVDHHGKPIGIGYVNPNSLIAARLVVRGVEHAFDRSLHRAPAQRRAGDARAALRRAVLPARVRRIRRTAGPYARSLRRCPRRPDHDRGHGAAQGRDHRGDRQGAQAAPALVEERRIDPRARAPAGIRRSRPRRIRSRRRACARAGSNSRSIRSAGRRPAGSTTSARTATGSRVSSPASACSTCSAISARGDCARRHPARAKSSASTPRSPRSMRSQRMPSATAWPIACARSAPMRSII